MKIKLLHILLFVLGFQNAVLSQSDFGVVWNVHTTGDIVEENPFNGGFTIKNWGENTFLVGDTLWYGYFIDGAKYDLALTDGLVSGEVLDEPFEPGDEIVVYNTFDWPLWEPELTIEMCAVVYGIGYDSYTGDLFTGDDNIENNTDCITAILPDYSVGINELNPTKNGQFYVQNNQLVWHNTDANSKVNAFFYLYDLTGQLIRSETVYLDTDNLYFNMDELSPSVYIAELQVNGTSFKQKIALL